MLYQNAAKKIKLLRIQKGLTQKQLADELGVCDKYISAVEVGRKRGSLEYYRDMANYFMVTFDYLFSDSLDVKTNFLIDSVILKMNYMSDEEQKYILDMVEVFSAYKEKKAGK